MEYTLYARHLDQDNFGFEIAPSLGMVAAEGLIELLTERRPAQEQSPFMRMLVLRQSDAGTAFLARPNQEIIARDTPPVQAADHVRGAMTSVGFSRVTIEPAAQPPEGNFTADELGAQYAEIKEALGWFLFRRFYNVSSDIEDAIQESFIVAWRHRYDAGELYPRVWFHTVSIRQMLRVLKRRRETLTGSGEVPDVIDPGHEGYSIMYRAAFLATSSLPPRQQEITRRLMGGETYAEIAATLGMQVNTVRGHALRARRKMKDLLAEGFEPWT